MDEVSKETAISSPVMTPVITVRGERSVQNQEPQSLADTAISHFNDFKASGELHELQTSVTLMKAAILAMAKEHLETAEHIWMLAEMIEERFHQFDNVSDLDEIILLETEALALTPQNHSDTPTRLDSLASSLHCKFERQGNLKDLERAIEYKIQAVSLSPQDLSDFPTRLSDLGSLLEGRFQQLGELNDLEYAIEYNRQALSLSPQDDPEIPVTLNNLGHLFKSRFQRLGELTDLTKAIECAGQAISLTSQEDPDMATWLNNLGSSLYLRFQRLGEPADLNQAIHYKELVVTLTEEGDPDMPGWLSNLGTLLDARFQRQGNTEDLDRAIEYNSQAVSLTSKNDLALPRMLHNLSSSLHSRYERQDKLADLDKTIECSLQAVSLTPQGHSNMSIWLNNLGISLEARFRRLGELSDLDKAIEYSSQAVAFTPAGHSDLHTQLNNLALSFETRFHRVGNLADLDKAIEHINRAVSLTPDAHSSMPTRLNNIGVLHESRFRHFGKLADLHKAIKYKTKAVSIAPQSHKDMSRWLASLGYSYDSQFQQSGEPLDLDTVIEYYSQALTLESSGHSETPALLNNLGFAYEHRYNVSGTVADIHKSLSCFQDAAEFPVGHPVLRFKTALQWARLSITHHISSPLNAYRQAMSLLPQVVWLGSAIGSRYQQIVDVGDVTTEAATVAIKLKECNLALEWLEEGRSIVWKQMLQLRTPFDELAAAHPGLALKLQKVAQDLDLTNFPQPLSQAFPPSSHLVEQASQQHRRLAESWDDLLKQARNEVGFETFICPRKASELMRAAQSGPVVVVNLDRTGCNALITLPEMSKILHIPLTLSYGQAINARIQIGKSVDGRELTQRYLWTPKREGEDSFERTLAVLWVTVVKPVLEALDYTEPPSTGDLPHITWCTTGPLAFLPLHAAGDYEKGEMTFKYVISSYAPTLSAILPSTTSNVFSGIMAVGQSSALGLPPLPGTANELDRIVEKTKGHLVTRLDNNLATPAAVLAGMESHSWVHLACHALQDTANPLQSAFYLHDGTLDLATIAQKQLKDANFAFLSACQTAKGDEQLPEEAVHLAAGMLMAGYKTVIATMWSIGDKDAPLIAEEVYGHLFEGGVPDARRAAVAVHRATARLRGEVGMRAFASWVPYIHIGL